VKSLVAILFFSAQSHAVMTEQVYLRKLRQAHSAVQLQQVQDEHDGLDQTKRICDLQLKENVVPWACYQRLQLEQRWELISKTQAHESQTKLNERCEAAAKLALRENPELLQLPEQSLSDECRHFVHQARDISHYRSHEIFSQTAGAEIENARTP
jgi:hypothetical protein